MEKTVVVAIAISADVTCADHVIERLDRMLSRMDSYEIIAINDKHLIIDQFAKARNFKITNRTCNNRVGAKQALASATHVIIFWSGYDLNEVIFLASLYKLPTKISAIPITSVVNKDSGSAFDIYIGRGSLLGNPFPIEHGSDKDRSHVIEKYKEHFYTNIVTNPEMQRYLEGIRGLRLGCHCKPLPCHGDIIADYLNNSLFSKN